LKISTFILRHTGENVVIILTLYRLFVKIPWIQLDNASGMVIYSYGHVAMYKMETKSMKTEVENNFRAQARILKALAHESRLAIVSRLAHGTCTVGELVSMIGGDQSTISKHLTVLRFAGIIDDERKGKTVEYRLVIPCVVEFLTCAIKVIQERKNMG